MRVPGINVSISMNTIKNTAKAISSDINTTTRHYRANATQGWQNGKRLSEIRGYGKTKSFLTRLGGSIAKTKVRNQDILPAVFAGLGTVSPLPGGTIVGFQLGKLFNKLFKFAK